MSNALVFIILGLTSGGAYSLTAVGIVTVYRGSGVLNFAQCAMGMAGAYTFYELRYGGIATLPTALALALGIAFGAVLGLVVYLAIMRRLVREAELARVVATIGVLLLFQGFATAHYGPLPIPVPAFLPAGGIHVETAILPYSTVVMLIALVVITFLLLALFRYTRLGLSATALRDRPDAAMVIGISPVPTGLAVWAVGGVMASIASILLLPVTQLAPSQATSLLFPAFAAGLLGRFRNYAVVIGAGMSIGIFQSVLIGYGWPAYLVNAIPFAIIVIALIAGGSTLPSRGLAVARLPKIGGGRSRPYLSLATIAVVAGSIFWSTEGWSVAVSASAVAGLIGLSVIVATGYAGQITFLPFSIAGLAALAGAHAASSWSLPFILVFVLATATGAVAGAISGLPALRVRGLDLAVLTLGMALAIETSVFVIAALNNNGEGILVPSPTLFGMEIDTTTHQRRYAIVALIVFSAAAVCTGNIRRSRAGRRLVSIRGNERGASAIGVSVVGAKIGAFALSGALAGAAGGMLIYGTTVFSVSSGFSTYMSMTALAWAIVGGVGMVPGGAFVGLLAAGGMGAYWFRNYQTVNSWLLVLSGAFVIYVMLTHPDGEIDRFAGLSRRAMGFRKTTARPAPVQGLGAD